MNNSIYVIWKSPQKRRNYVVGEIERNGGYSFKYGADLEEAKEEGFQLFLPFQEEEKIYLSKMLFPIFSTRLPDKKRPDIEKILRKYDLKEYDDFELLKCGAELPTDDLKFVEKIDESKALGSRFYVAGARHYVDCEERDCGTSKLVESDLKKRVEFVREFDNIEDSEAIQIQMRGETLGYVPRYYTNVINEMLRKKNICGEIVTVNKQGNCDYCIEVEIVSDDEH